jgi:hypothetical protein
MAPAAAMQRDAIIDTAWRWMKQTTQEIDTSTMQQVVP